MSDYRESYRQSLRASSIAGAASVANIVLGIIRNKAAAVLLGPSGLGMIGLLTSLMGTAAAVVGLGLSQVGIKSVAEANASSSPSKLANVRRALLLTTAILAVVGTVVFALSAESISRILSRPELTQQLLWLALGVGFSVAASAQVAVLNGLRKIADLSVLSVLGATFSTLIGAGALFFFGDRGIVVFILAGPIATFVLGCVFLSRLPRSAAATESLRDSLVQGRKMAQNGAAFMAAAAVATGAQLAVRAIVQEEIDIEAVGLFQASWTISMSYMGLILGAMGTDYLPRLASVIHDRKTANQLVNQQTQIAMLLAAPIFLAMLGLAPWIIEWLYSEKFSHSVSILRWQLLADVLKVVSWPLGFMLVAAGDGRTYLMTESMALLVFVVFTFLAIPWLGVDATGVAFLVMYLVYLPVIHWLAYQRSGFSWTPGVRRLILEVVAGALVVAVAASWRPLVGLTTGVALGLAAAIVALARLSALTEVQGPIGRLGAHSRRLLNWMGSK